MKLIKKIAIIILTLSASAQPCNAGLYDWVTKENVSAAFMGGALLELLIVRNLQLRSQQPQDEQPVVEEHPAPEVDHEIVNGLADRDKVDTGIQVITQPNSNLAVVRSLLENGLEVNTQNAEGNTLLHAACQAYNTEALDLMLAYDDVNPFIQNNHRFTPLDICAQNYRSGDEDMGEKVINIATTLLLRADASLPNSTTALRIFGQKQDDPLATELLYLLQSNTEFFNQLFALGQILIFSGEETAINNVFKDQKDEPREGEELDFKKRFRYQGRRPIINFVEALCEQDIKYIEIDHKHSGYKYFKTLLDAAQEEIQPTANDRAWWQQTLQDWQVAIRGFQNTAWETAFEWVNHYTGVNEAAAKDLALKFTKLACKKIPLPGAEQIFDKGVAYWSKRLKIVDLGRPVIISHLESGKIKISVEAERSEENI